MFTPKGDVKALPKGATPIDFAYAVHTEVGDHCSGAKVNGKLVPLRYKLQHGDTVEIITSPNQHPSKDWLKIVKSTRARTKINQWLKIEERARSLALGRELFEREAQLPALPRRPARVGGDEAGRRRLGLPDRRRPPGVGRLRQDLGAAGAGQAHPRRRARGGAPTRRPRRRPRPRKPDGAACASGASTT